MATSAIVALSYFVAASLSILVSRLPDNVADIWLANALALVVLLRSPRADAPALLFSAFVAGVAANLLGGSGLVESVGLMLANLAEIWIALAAIRLVVSETGRLDTVITYARVLAIACVAGPAVGGCIGAAVIVAVHGTAFFAVLWSWWTGTIVGSLLVLPVALSVTPQQIATTFSPRGRVRLAFSAIAVMASSALALAFTAHPFVLVSLPAAVVGMLLNPLATAIVSSLAIISMTLTQAFHLGDAGTSYAAGNASRFFGALAVVVPLAVSLLIEQLRRERARVVESEQRFRLAMSEAPIGMAVIGLDHSWLQVNRAVCELLGYSAEELRTRTFADITHPDDLEADLSLVQRTLSGEINGYRLEKRYIRKDGSVVHGLLAVALMRDEITKEPLYFISQIADVTQLKETQSALVASESRWQFALESARQGVWDFDVKSGRTYYSPMWKAMLGLGDKEFGVSGSLWQTLVHPEDLPRVVALDRAHLEGRTDEFECEFRMRHKDGGWIWILDRGKVIERDADGAVVRMIGTHTDITHLKQVEKALATAEGRWNFALDSAGQGVWDYDILTARTFYSPTFKRIFGYGSEEPFEDLKDWRVLVHPDDLPKLDKMVATITAGTAGEVKAEFRMRHNDGRWIWVLCRGKVIERSADGATSRALGTVTDVTARVQAQADLAGLAERLEQEKERLRITLRSIGDGVICTDVEGRVTFLNPRAERETGWSEGEAVGRPVGEVFRIVDDKNGAPLDGPIRTAISLGQGESTLENVMLIGRQGRRRYVRGVVTAMNSDRRSPLGIVIVFQDTTEARRLQKRLAHSAAHDALTGLRNRASFEEELTLACADATGNSRQHALCLLDLDYFKPVNDEGGHAAGDAMLRAVASAIRKTVRAEDCIARLGGDEFAVVLRDCSLQSATSIAEKIVHAIGAVKVDHDGRGFRVGASAGIALILAGALPDDVLRDADAACYAAKAAGRGRVSVSEGLNATRPIRAAG